VNKICLCYSLDMKYDLIIIGGGSAGLMAAVVAAEKAQEEKKSVRICILEKNARVGEKLRISGGGRCNITNNTLDIREFLESYGENAKYLFSAFSEFSTKDTFSFFERLGLPLVTQARNRVFPHTERAEDVCQALFSRAQKLGVEIYTKSPVSEILQKEGSIFEIRVRGEFFQADSYILATGGVSHPETGSTGDGFGWLRDLGHTIHTPTPSIVPLRVAEKWVETVSGVALSFVKITFLVDGKKAFSKKGKILFTHFGLSAPLILNSSAEVAKLLPTGEVTANIDMYPDTDIGALDAQLVRLFDINKNKLLKNIAKEFCPEGMYEAVLKLLEQKGVQGDTKVHSITKVERRKIGDILKGVRLTVTGLMGFDRAVIADGGVPLSEIDTRTMRSKKIKNLYVIGDLLHVNRPSGGYSLQLCWTTGFIAGRSAV
jgi:predicted Rossmann fold flavoprotein